VAIAFPQALPLSRLPMNTPSHFIMTAALERGLQRVPILKRAFLLGSIAPDIPLWLLSIGGMIYYPLIQGWSRESTARFMFDELYFHNPVWIVLHNFLHSPVLLLAGLAIVWKKRRNIGSRSRWGFWFLMACLLHSGVDILTHADDGPLLFFPFDWATRFHSPISYWDSRHYGREFQRFELALNGVLLVYLLKNSVCRSIRQIRLPYRDNS
jgi:membrane-bound metal-dependent hydrolase YbcI (DUF457 family)